MNKSVAVIGGGITGLTAAFRLREAGAAVTLYEGGARVGGVIQTVRRNGFLAECGPNTILETSPKIGKLVADLGIEDRKMHSAPEAEARYLVRNGELVPLPSSFFQFLSTRLFSTGAKLRLFAEPFIAPAAAEREETIEQFVVRRLGREFLDYAINPLVRGVYAGDPSRLSVKQAFPKLHALEQKYHSLIRGQIFGARERRRRAEVSKQSAKKLSFDEGLQVLTDALAKRLGESVRLNTMVTQLEETPDGWKLTAKTNAEECVAVFDAVLFAGTAGRLAQLRILGNRVPDLKPMSQIHYPPVASVVMGFRREHVRHPLSGFGVLIPEVEKFNILGTIFSSALFPNRAPAGHVTLTSYLGGARNPEMALKEPAEIELHTLRDLQKLFGITGRPVFTHHFVFPKAIPQYETGYQRFKDLMTAVETACPGFFIAGHFRDGISLGDSIVSGHDAAERILSGLECRSGTRAALEGRLQPAA